MVVLNENRLKYGVFFNQFIGSERKELEKKSTLRIISCRLLNILIFGLLGIHLLFFFFFEGRSLHRAISILKYSNSKTKESSAPACFSINVIILSPFNSFIL
jgi:hypothetical protein